MLILKHFKTLQHVSIIIQIIIREFAGSLLKSLNIKFYCQLLNVVMRQHNVWCGEVCWGQTYLNTRNVTSYISALVGM